MKHIEIWLKNEVLDITNILAINPQQLDFSFVIFDICLIIAPGFQRKYDLFCIRVN